MSARVRERGEGWGGKGGRKSLHNACACLFHMSPTSQAIARSQITIPRLITPTLKKLVHVQRSFGRSGGNPIATKRLIKRHGHRRSPRDCGPLISTAAFFPRLRTLKRLQNYPQISLITSLSPSTAWALKLSVSAVKVCEHE